MSPLVAFLTLGALVNCIDSHSTVRVTNKFGPGRESIYSFSYKLNDPRTDDREIRNDGSVEEIFFFLKPDGSRRFVGGKYLERNFPTSANIESSSIIESQISLASHDQNSNNHGYPLPGQPSNSQFYSTIGETSDTRQVSEKNLREQLPPGYVALVAKIDTPEGYKLFGENNY